jgi:hypothetical protein
MLRPGLRLEEVVPTAQQNVASSFSASNPNQRHSGFFAASGLGRRTVLVNAKKTGIQVRPAAKNIYLLLSRIKKKRAVPLPRLPKIDSGLFAAWHNLRYTSFLHREKPE